MDKKIIERADKYKEKPLELSNRFCEEYWVDMDALHCLRPTDEQRVSGHIDQIIKMVEKIIENGFGYAVEGGDVFFSVDKLTDYGQLSGQVLDHTRVGERVAVDPRKRSPADSPCGRLRNLMRRSHLGRARGVHEEDRDGTSSAAP